MLKNTRRVAESSAYLRFERRLKPPDAFIDYDNALRLHHPNTGRWFLRGQRFSWFKTTLDARIWLRGFPGCGKTVLASAVIEDLQTSCSSPALTVIYFFFTFSNASKQTLGHLLRSLIFQLAGLHESTKSHLSITLEHRGGVFSRVGHSGLVSLFDEMTAKLQTVAIVLDALDESSEYLELLRWITSPSRKNCRFLLTSRSERHIEEMLASWLPPNCTVTLEKEPVDEDIKAYIDHRLQTEGRLSRWKSIHETISCTLVQQADGMLVPRQYPCWTLRPILTD